MALPDALDFEMEPSEADSGGTDHNIRRYLPPFNPARPPLDGTSPKK